MRKEIAYSIGVFRSIDPRYIVVTQLNTLTAEGIATRNVRNEKIAPASVDWPLTKRWWPQTRNPMTAIATDENAIAL
jgi:hypothetical protein